jgi:hypothetical protein
MEFITLALSGMNPDADKFNYFDKYPNAYECTVLAEQKMDFGRSYFLVNSKTDVIRNYVMSVFNDESSISSEVLNNVFFFLDKLEMNILDAIEVENVYTSPYGTLIIDWEKDIDNVFSLEFGAKEIGYFIEIDGRDIKQVDEKELIDSFSVLSADLSNFLSV